jgi:hypothetical protein
MERIRRCINVSIKSKLTEKIEKRPLGIVGRQMKTFSCLFDTGWFSEIYPTVGIF